jgi:hypothetical protein
LLSSICIINWNIKMIYCGHGNEDAPSYLSQVGIKGSDIKAEKLCD